MKKSLESLQLISNKFASNPTNKLILIRCMENKGLLSGSLNGWLNTSLSDYGIKQSRYLSVNYFSEYNSYSSVFISDLTRCKESVDICFGYSIPSVIINPYLREISYADIFDSSYLGSNNC